MPPEQVPLAALYANPAQVMAELVVIDLVDLERCLAKHALLYAFIVGTCEQEKAMAAAAKGDLDFILSQETLRNRETMSSNVGAEQVAKIGVRYIAQLKKKQEHDRRSGILKRFVDALDHRRDMIVQIAARQRQEIALHSQH